MIIPVTKNSITHPAHLSSSATMTFNSCMNALQEAEEAQGAEDYNELMNAIITECVLRKQNYRNYREAQKH